MSTGELVRGPDGRLRLAEEPHPPTAEELLERRPARGDRDSRAVWNAMREYLAEYPSGLSVAELVEAAETRHWTTEEDAGAIVRRALARAGSQIEELPDGRIRLARPEEDVPARPTVRLRKRQRPVAEEEGAEAPSAADDA